MPAPRLNLLLFAACHARSVFKPLLDRHFEVITARPQLSADLVEELLHSVQVNGVVLLAEDSGRAVIDLTKRVETLNIPYLLVLEKCHSASTLFELASREFVLISQNPAQVEVTIKRFVDYLTDPSRKYRGPNPNGARLPGDIWVRQSYGDRRIALGDIRSISADKDYAVIELPTTSLLVRSTLSELEEKLDGREFVRIHRSHIVPAQRIKELRNATRHRHQVQLDDGSILPVGKTYWPKLRDRLHRRTLR